jgi:hypothetical protein
MFATEFEIVSKRRPSPVDLADIKDFELRECGQIEASEILTNECISLYAFDLQGGQAVFVETAPPAELSQAPFYYQAQYENTRRVFTLPFDVMIGLAQAVTPDDSKLIFIQSMGRCGSTLASKLFAQLPGVINMSEPDTLTELVIARFLQPDKQTEMKMLLDATVRLLCKTPAQTAWVIKGRSFVLELGDWLHELYPQAKTIYLYREAESWIKSNLNAFADVAGKPPEAIRQREIEARGWMQFVVPSVAHYAPDQHLKATELTTLMWLDSVERYVDWNKAGIGMLAIPYSSWKLDPLRTTLSMLVYCGHRPNDLSAIEETLSKDSQAGSAIAQETIKNNTEALALFDRAEMNLFLQNHPYIHSADFEAPNSLKL